MVSYTKPKIIVITPVKNEEWILDRFLQVTTQFADHVIIADQLSTDRSPEICRQYSKVTLIENNSKKYDESQRQLLLIQKARELVPGQKILLALDADEIMAANAPTTVSWQTMLAAKPGTIFYFQKQDLYPTPEHYITYQQFFPLGYMDDSAEHVPKKIHSTRIPTPDTSQRLYFSEIKILHYTWTRPECELAKKRMYSLIENISKTKNLAQRRQAYSVKNTYMKSNKKLLATPTEWFKKWEDLGIDMRTITHYKYYWQDIEVLRLFCEHGTRRFWSEPIWYFNWEACRIYAEKQGYTDIFKKEVNKPPYFLKINLLFLDFFYKKLQKILRSTANN